MRPNISLTMHIIHYSKYSLSKFHYSERICQSSLDSGHSLYKVGYSLFKECIIQNTHHSKYSLFKILIIQVFIIQSIHYSGCQCRRKYWMTSMCWWIIMELSSMYLSLSALCVVFPIRWKQTQPTAPSDMHHGPMTCPKWVNDLPPLYVLNRCKWELSPSVVPNRHKFIILCANWVDKR